MKKYDMNIATQIWIGKLKSRLLIVTESCTSSEGHRQIGAFVIKTEQRHAQEIQFASKAMSSQCAHVSAKAPLQLIDMPKTFSHETQCDHSTVLSCFYA